MVVVQGRIALVWDNFRPSHIDRACALRVAGYEVTAIELHEASSDYDWQEERDAPLAISTMVPTGRKVRSLGLAVRLVRCVIRSGARDVLLCHYERPAVFIAACILRLGGRRLYIMLDSKFDDYPRHWSTTLVKVPMLMPYRGAMVASARSRDYVAYLGIDRQRIVDGYNSLDIAQLRHLAGDSPQPAFWDRPFVVVARLVPKKNLKGALQAFAAYRSGGGKREMAVIGDGPLAEELHAFANELRIGDCTRWLGSQPRRAVLKCIRDGIALILPSFEEQFGHVVIEALALGVPVIVSSNAGAVDVVVENLINGYVIDPHKPQELLAAMGAIGDNESTFDHMSRAAVQASERGDVSHFVDAVSRLITS